MSIYKLSDKPDFPPLNFATEDGLLAFGGKINPLWIIEAYSKGIFPWFNEDEPILWWSPNPRSVFFIDNIHISKTMKKFLKKPDYKVTFDSNFLSVIEACASTRKETWISKEIVKNYEKLHEMGVAHSVEVWNNGRLVGGLYGLSLGKMFFGESMFSIEPNSSKLALIVLAEFLKKRGYRIIDCQVHNPHLESLGAKEIDRDEFMKILNYQIEQAVEYKKWEIE